MSDLCIPTRRTVDMEARGAHGPIWCSYTGLMTDADVLASAQVLADSTGAVVRLYVAPDTFAEIAPAAAP